MIELAPDELFDSYQRNVMAIENRLPTAEERSTARADLAKRLRERGVPARLIPFAFKAEETLAAQLALRLLRGEGLLLVLSGPTGCGKSTAGAVALGRKPGRWIHAPDLAHPPPDDSTIERDMRRSALLVFDDVGIEHSPSGYAASRLCDVLTYREANLAATIVTTNLTADQFKQRYGERIALRVNGDALGFQHVAGPDLRVRANGP